MDALARRRELGRFLRDRRGRLRPEDVGLPAGARRRVPGLRREEVAALAGVGATWYTMLENGTAAGVSGATLAAIAHALRLGDGELHYLLRLADERVAEPPSDALAPLARGALDAVAWAPAYVCTSHWTVLRWNAAMALVWALDPPGAEPFNIVARTFADPAIRAMHGERFPAFASTLVAMVRGAIAAWLEDPAYRRLCDGLREDPAFARAWDAYDVDTPLASPAITVDSLAVGTFTYEALTLELPGRNGHWLVLQIPDGPSADRLRAALAPTVDAVARPIRSRS